MKRLHYILPFLVLALGACKSTERAGEGAASVEDEIIAKNVAARGGLASLRAVQSARMEGTVYLPGMGMTMPLTMQQKRPFRMRMDVSIPSMGMQVVTAYDGETAWTINPMMGGRPMKMPADQARDVRTQADIDGLLIDYRDKGLTVTYAGDAEVEGAPAKKLVITRPDSSTVTSYLDAETFMEVKNETEGTHPMTGQKSQVAILFKDYREVAGVRFPYKMEVYFDGEAFQQITLTDVQFNVAVEDGIFIMPEK